MVVAKLLRRAAGQLGGALDLLPVLVGAGEEPGLDAQGALAPRDRVAHDGRVGVAQVRPRIHVVDGRGEVKTVWAGVLIWSSAGVCFRLRLVGRHKESSMFLFHLRLQQGCVKRERFSALLESP